MHINMENERALGCRKKIHKIEGNNNAISMLNLIKYK